LPNYFSITKGRLVASTPTPSTIIIGASAGPTPGGSGNGLIVKAQVLPAFDLVTEFFEELCINYQGVKTEKTLYIVRVSTLIL
jgi:hypothetical protein